MDSIMKDNSFETFQKALERPITQIRALMSVILKKGSSTEKACLLKMKILMTVILLKTGCKEKDFFLEKMATCTKVSGKTTWNMEKASKSFKMVILM